MIKTILFTLLLAIVASGCVGTITHKEMAKNSPKERQNNVIHHAKPTKNIKVDKDSTKY